MTVDPESFSPAAGRCTCGAVRYRMLRPPMFVHCCHCTWCQRETGAAFAWNALLERDAVEIVAGELETIDTPSASGRGQRIVRCARCRVATWSHYAGAGDAVRFVRVGTLEEPARFPPDVHIFTSTKQPWVRLEDGKPVCEEFYRRSQLWPPASIDRYNVATGRAAAR